MKPSIHFLNGKFVTEKDLLISPRDLGFARGYAVFDFLRTFNHKPFKLKEHIDRLFNSLDLMDLKIPWSKEQISNWVLETLNKNDLNQEWFIKISVSGGVSSTLLLQGKPTLIILLDPAISYPTTNYTNGVTAKLVKFQRSLPGAKSNNYIEAVKQFQSFAGKDIFEPIYYNDTQVFEGSNSNVFAVVDNQLITTKNNILAGITRNVLLDILRLNIPIKVKDFTKDQLLRSQEVFLSASGKGITPIVKIDNHKIGSGQVGPITKEVMKQYQEYTSIY